MTETPGDRIRQQLMKAEWPHGGHGTLASALAALADLTDQLTAKDALLRRIAENGASWRDVQAIRAYLLRNALSPPLPEQPEESTTQATKESQRSSEQPRPMRDELYDGTEPVTAMNSDEMRQAIEAAAEKVVAGHPPQPLTVHPRSLPEQPDEQCPDNDWCVRQPGHTGNCGGLVGHSAAPEPGTEP